MVEPALQALDPRAAIERLEACSTARTVLPRLELGHVGQDTGVHEESEPTEEELEQAPERIGDEDAMRGPGHDDPHDVVDPDPSSADS